MKPIIPCLVLVCLLLGAAQSAMAQDRPHVDVAGGYQYVRALFEDDSDALNYPKGLFASAAWNVTNRLALVGEFARSAEFAPAQVDFEADVLRFGDIDSTLYSTLGGVRWWFEHVFVQALIGQVAVRTRADLLSGTLDETVTDTMIQAGAGVNVPITSHVAARVHGDYRHVRGNEGPFKRQFRIAVGAAVGIGGRESYPRGCAPRTPAHALSRGSLASWREITGSDSARGEAPRTS